ncbi:hypothetical protein ACXYTP_21575 [Tsukamurella ocularis]
MSSKTKERAEALLSASPYLLAGTVWFYGLGWFLEQTVLLGMGVLCGILCVSAFIGSFALRAQDKAKKRSDAERAAAQRKMAEQQRLADEAAERTRREAYERERLHEQMQSRLRATQRRAIQIKDSLPSLVGAVGASLSQAEQHFQRGAYSPFWQSIEEATVRLGTVTESLQTLQDASEQSRRDEVSLLKMFQERSTPFPVRLSDIRAAEHGQIESKRMDDLVARAQVNFQFASIYEQRRTSAILIAGFQNLGSAISGMSEKITNQLMRVVSAIDSASYAANDAALASSKQSKEALEMLDNIQRRYDPGFGSYRNY